MDILRTYQEKMLDQVDDRFFRYLFYQFPWDQRMTAIKGLRGAGKTTMMLQFLKYRLKSPDEALYFSADNPWFYNHTLLDTVHDFVKMGGRYLFIDEIHKYAQWSRELKNIYDIFGELKVVFSASSALDIYRGEADLSRRVLTYELPGLSFREYLELVQGETFPVVTMADLLNDHVSIARKINQKIRPLPHFKNYLQNGYLPIVKDAPADQYLPKIANIINTVLEYDISFIEGYTATNLVKIKKLLGIIAESVPYEPNISELARKMQLGRDTVNNYLRHLQKGRILNLVQKQSRGMAALKKPDKIYLENSNFSHALKKDPDKGSVREGFLLNQLLNAGHEVYLPPKGDFYVAGEELSIEVGGKNKDVTQIKDLPKAVVAADDIEHGFGPTIPLWLFGFLY